MTTRRSVLGMLGAVPLALAARPAFASPNDLDELDDTIQRVIQKFPGSTWGMAFSAPDSSDILYSLRPDQLFVAASSMKVFIAGTAFATLGADHRFRTRIVRTGPVHDGVLRGDLVLVAGGDLLVGGRVRPDGTLLLPDPDHTYGTAPGAAPLHSDPLGTLRRFADDVAAAGITRVDGRVLVDVSMFREGREDIANGGLFVTTSAMMLNDNVMDVVVTPGPTVGAPAALRITPDVGYVRILNQTRTTASPGQMLNFVNDVANPDGTHAVALVGDVPIDAPGLFCCYYVPEPGRFAAAAFAKALRDNGVDATADLLGTPQRHGSRLTEQVSLPLSEQVKVMLKVSSNVHTATWPYVVGAACDPRNPVAAYKDLRARLYSKAGLDPHPAGEDDGRYTADFFVKFLNHVKGQPYYPRFRTALPIMGRDGSLANVQVNSPAAGHVYAKTGTAMVIGPDSVLHKALAGYIVPPSGRPVAFSQMMTVPGNPETVMRTAAQVAEAMGEIATAVYLAVR
ncbi:D-alanyl-D-alanine carboxypeptidase/D-alanyl-D-alanine endopeptidase [Actinocrispum wychmicini]|uniref:D-alanyl-D-alanine carboxypeptidase/D-alanyl-D-alanine-endopeptidase (Penicillin-binding protein 4) n=1 Tax=Actinocrispum wychmicini TaxID=1213861 RepID=A0A4R2JBZ5_9PSEU|nr:D-alanyl-D-alanine carboxypeptidase/D-alanyl-D-alanine-endopeptidase [Actinocrispum wychmicini]TCO54296.1 D-alanyl-D-alanine carboxypeptidase/D-alanyl-D-alanine-endopeptidase (penicillin-binding protein 4) [Actinocrispum wychmicini]